MDVQWKTAVIAGLVVLGAGTATSSFAQERVDAGESSGRLNPVHCDSGPAGAKNYCGVADVKYTIESPSPGSCVRGQTWGSDEKGVWVTGSCSADFDGVGRYSRDTRHDH